MYMDVSQKRVVPLNPPFLFGIFHSKSSGYVLFRTAPCQLQHQPSTKRLDGGLALRQECDLELAIEIADF